MATTSEYPKRCFDRIWPTLEENEQLKAQVAQLQGELAEANAQRAALAEQVAIQASHLVNVDQERMLPPLPCIIFVSGANDQWCRNAVDDAAAPGAGREGEDGMGQGGLLVTSRVSTITSLNSVLSLLDYVKTVELTSSSDPSERSWAVRRPDPRLEHLGGALPADVECPSATLGHNRRRAGVAGGRLYPSGKAVRRSVCYVVV